MSDHDDKGWGPNAQLALDTIAGKPSRGIPSWMLNVMDHAVLEKTSGHATGSYPKEPKRVYLDFQLKIGTCMLDQWIPENPLTIGGHGYEAEHERGATTGRENIVLDGMTIDSPEAVAEHMERFEFPKLKARIAEYQPLDPAEVSKIIKAETEVQDFFGTNMLKVPYISSFPALRYFRYGYANYFMAYALFPEIMERDFALQAELAVKTNTKIARAIVEGKLPRVIRLDHDMADSRSTLVDIHSLDNIWFSNLVKSIQPFLDAGIRLLWHCDGNLMEMVPRLIEAGISGFQGFQYEDGMDYEKICRMTDRDGNPLMIWAGVSVTRTLPMGTVDDVKKEMKWLVANGPRTGLFLGGSSSITPGTNHDNIKTLIEGLKYYREHGRD
jgi:hypothetical protein